MVVAAQRQAAGIASSRGLHAGIQCNAGQPEVRRGGIVGQRSSGLRLTISLPGHRSHSQAEVVAGSSQHAAASHRGAAAAGRRPQMQTIGPADEGVAARHHQPAVAIGNTAGVAGIELHLAGIGIAHRQTGHAAGIEVQGMAAGRGGAADCGATGLHAQVANLGGGIRVKPGLPQLHTAADTGKGRHAQQAVVALAHGADAQGVRAGGNHVRRTDQQTGVSKGQRTAGTGCTAVDTALERGQRSRIGAADRQGHRAGAAHRQWRAGAAGEGQRRTGRLQAELAAAASVGAAAGGVGTGRHRDGLRLAGQCRAGVRQLVMIDRRAAIAAGPRQVEGGSSGSVVGHAGTGVQIDAAASRHGTDHGGLRIGVDIATGVDQRIDAVLGTDGQVAPDDDDQILWASPGVLRRQIGVDARLRLQHQIAIEEQEGGSPGLDVDGIPGTQGAIGVIPAAGCGETGTAVGKVAIGLAIHHCRQIQLVATGRRGGGGKYLTAQIRRHTPGQQQQSQQQGTQTCQVHRSTTPMICRQA